MMGKEQVRRSDVIPSSNTSWVHVSDDVIAHRCSDARGYEEGSITFSPLDACKFELMR